MQEKTKDQNGQKIDKDKFAEDLINRVYKEFEDRRKERLKIERGWELNMKFLSGEQYCDVSKRGDIIEEDKCFYWQNRGVYNHIAPIMDSRLAKFSRINPTIAVRPKTDDDKDVLGASVAQILLENTLKNIDVSEVVKKVTCWSETCGTGFYKVIWNNNGGNSLGFLDGKEVFEGQADVIAVSPFEIFPDNLYTENICDQQNIIHAKALPVDVVNDKYGCDLQGEDVDVYNLTRESASTNLYNSKSVVHNAVLVLETYEKPTKKYPNGRLYTVANGQLLYYGELPYLSGENKTRTYPFIKQVSVPSAGNFFGTSIIERLIPVQRAFNAVKNRKHEFLNRLSMGVMNVEDGSIDTEDLETEGLSPGKVLVYRQGAKAPEMLSGMSMPSDFEDEEQRLLNEFVIISGVSDVASNGSNAVLSSGTALQILVEQNNEKLILVAENIRKAYVEFSKQIIRLYAQFIADMRIINYRDSFNKSKTIYASKNSINSDDVYLINENELLFTESQRKDLIFKLYGSGLLADKNGEIRPSIKEKLLSLLGYKDLDYGKGISRLQEEKAQSENEKMLNEKAETEFVDDDEIHIDEHTRYFLSEYADLTKEQKDRFYEHIKSHTERKELSEKKQKEGN